MNILVTGANGQLGTELRILSRQFPDNRYLFTDVTDVPGVETIHLDICDRDAVRLVAASEKIDVIVNCAAYTNVDRAEDDEKTARLLNAGAADNLAFAARETGATLIHISTDYVFSGDGCVPIPETEPTAPRSVYGRTKLEGELAVRNSGCNYIILRTAWLYSPFGKNFVKTMRRLTAENESISVVFDQVGTPTSAADLAAAIMHIIATGQLDKKGIYHFTDEGVASWFDFACAIAALSGNKCDVRPCRSDQFPSKVARPHYSVLDKRLVKETFGVVVPHWYEALKTCIARMD